MESEEEIEDIFSEGMPDFVGSNYAIPKDYFWHTEIEYNGQNLQQ
jgi:hypothetical protein